jgi:DNA polymerase-1
METVVAEAREQGYVKTVLDRRRYLPDINSTNAIVRGYAERNAINAPIQGSAADVIKVAMVAVQKDIRERNLKSKMILQVHDELVIDNIC